MRKIKLYFSALILTACASTSNVGESKPSSNSNNATNTNPNTSTSVTTNSNSVATNSNNGNSSSNNFVSYTKHPQATALLTEDQLKAKKQFTKLGDALKEPQNVFRLRVGEYETGFDLLQLSAKIGDLYNLQELEINGIYENLPKEIGKLTQLQNIILDLPNLKKELPNEIGNWKNVKFLYIKNDLSSASTMSTVSYKNLDLIEKVDYFRLEGKFIKEIPCSIGKMKIKKLHFSFLNVSEIPGCISSIKDLEKVEFAVIKNVNKLPSLPSSVTDLDISGMDNLIDVTALTQSLSNLKRFNLFECKKLTTISDFPIQNKMESYTVSKCASLTKLSSFDNMSYLNTLIVNNLPLLEGQLISQQNKLYRLKTIYFSDLVKNILLPDLSSSFFFYKLTLKNVPNFKSAVNFKNMTGEMAKKRNEIEYFLNDNLSTNGKERAFQHSQDFYFEFYDMVTETNALKTIRKDKVKRIHFTLDEKTNEIYPTLLNQLNTFPKLEAIDLIFYPSFKIKEFDLKTINSVKVLYISNAEVQTASFDYNIIAKFVSKFPNTEDLSIVTRNVEVLTLDYISLPNLIKISMDAAGGSMLKKDRVPTDLPILLKAPNLQEITFSGVTSTLPENIYKLSKLKSVFIQVDEPPKNYQLKISNQIGNLKNLESFELGVYTDISNSVLSANLAPEINSLTKLKVLKINVVNMNNYTNGQKPFTYPDGIEKLTNLEKLELNIVTANPKGLEKLTIKEKRVIVK